MPDGLGQQHDLICIEQAALWLMALDCAAQAIFPIGVSCGVHLCSWAEGLQLNWMCCVDIEPVPRSPGTTPSMLGLYKLMLPGPACVGCWAAMNGGHAASHCHS